MTTTLWVQKEKGLFPEQKERQGQGEELWLGPGVTGRQQEQLSLHRYYYIGLLKAIYNYLDIDTLQL